MTISDEIIANPIIRNVQALLENQTAKGLAKYGTTVNPNDYSVEEWIQHASEEIIDFLVYLQVLKVKLNESHMKLARENEELIKTVRFYAQQGNWTFRDDERIFSPSEVEMDKGHLARKTLEELGYEFENKS